jgi:FKBP-type peptidyl-prolyl cis-trans isomerase SlyD
MQIAPHTVVSLSYTLTLDNGNIADQTDGDHPFVFIHGIGQTLALFDQNLNGLKAGDHFNFTIGAADGYGTSHPDRIINIARSVFEGPDVPAEMLTVGNFVPMQDQDGNPMDGLILEIDDEKVRMDFNHPLAGQSLHFAGNIIDVRKASPEEISHGHVHGPGGHHH